jgi:hypothetical protein
MKDISAVFKTWKQAGSREIDAFFNYLKTHSEFTPERLGCFEPLKRKFEETDLKAFERMLLEERFLLTNRKKPPRQSFQIDNLDRPKWENNFGHYLMASHLGKGLSLQEYLDFLTDLFLLFDFEYGKVCHADDWDIKNMQIDGHGMKALSGGLGKHLPGIYWANFFGRRYVEFFGRDRLLNAPAYKIEELENGGILLLTSESPLDFEREEVKLREKEIIQFLGEEAFFSKDGPPNKKYCAPDFKQSNYHLYPHEHNKNQIR